MEPLEPDDTTAEPNSQHDTATDWPPPASSGAEEGLNPVRRAAVESTTPTKRQGRGRGRPRVLATRDDSAIERRRAQVRKSQRAYQMRKNTAAHSNSQRNEELLQALSTLSGVVEDLLIAATECGVLEQRDDLGTQMRTLWSTYDATINQPCIDPELRSLRMKNQQRMSEYESRPKPRIQSNIDEDNTDHGGQPIESTSPSAKPLTSLDWSNKHGDATTLYQSFTLRPSVKDLTGRTLYDIVAERQAAFRNSGGHG